MDFKNHNNDSIRYLYNTITKERLQKKTADLVTLSKKGGRGQEKGEI